MHNLKPKRQRASGPEVWGVPQRLFFDIDFSIFVSPWIPGGSAAAAEPWNNWIRIGNQTIRIGSLGGRRQRRSHGISRGFVSEIRRFVSEIRGFVSEGFVSERSLLEGTRRQGDQKVRTSHSKRSVLGSRIRQGDQKVRTSHSKRSVLGAGSGVGSAKETKK